MERRDFLSKIPWYASLPLAATQMLTKLNSSHQDSLKIASRKDEPDDMYWRDIQALFDSPIASGDFNGAGLGTATKPVLLLYEELRREMNIIPSRKISNAYRNYQQPAKAILAELIGSTVDEVAIVRNATEAMSTSIFGIPLKEGDEVILGRLDYVHTYFAWQQRAARDGIVLKYAEIPACPKNPGQLIKAFKKQVSKKTRAIHITDLINVNGCRVPTREILDEMPSHVRYKLVDAAQSFANTNDDFASIGATHVGASLHKWYGLPAAAGLLYVNKDYVQETWPLHATNDLNQSTCTRFEHLGTRDMALYPAIKMLGELHQSIGIDRKRKRLTFLADYFVEQISKNKKVKVISPRHESLKSNIVLFDFEIEEIKNRWFKKLRDEYNIHFTSMNWNGVVGRRVSFNMFHSKDDVDRLVDALVRS